MADDDFSVIAFYLLSYLYGCLKRGDKPERSYLRLEVYPFEISESYLAFIYSELQRKGYIRGAVLFKIPLLGKSGKELVLKSVDDVEITMDGIVYLQNNDQMRKVWRHIQEAGGLLLKIISTFGALHLFDIEKN